MCKYRFKFVVCGKPMCLMTVGAELLEVLSVVAIGSCNQLPAQDKAKCKSFEE